MITSTFAYAQGARIDEDAIASQRLIEMKHDFERLKLEKRKEFLKLKKKAAEDYEHGKYVTCLVAISDAQQIFAMDLDLILYRGLCKANLRDVDTAIQCYKKVLEIIPYHQGAILNLIEINFFSGRYMEASEHIIHYKKVAKIKGFSESSVLDFKYLISITKLAREYPSKYEAELTKLHGLHTYMDDTPYYYYANALKEFDAGNKEEGKKWIHVAYSIFRDAPLIISWNKALVDTGYIGANENMFNNAVNKQQK
jgi:tetratricopeptide (TPR) repeat protein